MITLSGKSVFGGVAIGKIAFYKRQEKQVRRYRVEDTEAEVARFEDAQETAIAQLGELYDKAMEDVGEANAAIFEVHQMMLMDLDYVDSIKNIITTQEVNAEYAVATTGDNFSQMFASMDDAYMQGRAADVKDVSDRLLGILSDAGESGVVADEPVIVAADDLVPSETVQLDKSKVLAFATMYGSANSHTAILARTMNIRPVIGLGEGLAKNMTDIWQPSTALPGPSTLIPDEETMKAMTEKREEDRRQKTLLEELKGKENVTLSGQKINVYANIGNLSDVGRPYLKMMQEGSDFSEASSCIWKAKISRPKNSSSRYTNRFCRKYGRQKGHYPYPGYREQTSRWITLDLTKKEPGTGIPGNPYLPDKTGDLQDPASCPVPGICPSTDRSPLCSR